MATVENTTVKIYKGVPLIKGGTEVLYLAQAQAEAALVSFLFKTYTKFYYQRENRGYIQIEDTIDELEGANYVSFVNSSHGTKIYFAFIDRLVYINDEVTQLEYTIDPFPTYLGDTTAKNNCFLLRNTVKTDTPRVYMAPDYLPKSAGVRWNSLAVNWWDCQKAVVYFASKDPDASYILAPNGTQTGIRFAFLTQTQIEYIQQNNGVIIGCYLIPNVLLDNTPSFDAPIVKNLGTITGNAAAVLSSQRWEKTKSGVYNSIVLRTSQGSKSYDLESFLLREQITFGVVGLMVPTPSIFIYPKNYCGVVDNLSEGIMMSCPSLPISASAQYTNLQQFSDTWAIAEGAIAGAIGGLVKGGTIGGIPTAIAGGIAGAGASIISAAKNQISAKFQPPSVGSMGEPCVASDFQLKAQLELCSPMTVDLNRIDNYFDYYGYSIDAVETPNLDDEAYLQTGEEFLFGSEADLVLNARLMNGIKIRKTLT